MNKICKYLLLPAMVAAFIGCSSTKNVSDLKASRSNLSGTWTVSGISVDLPENFKISNVFDEAPYQDFEGSTWELIRNGKGFFSLTNGTKEEIYWSVYNEGDNPQFQFKKLNGEKARNVDDGYRLQIQNISSTSFVARTAIETGNGETGYITYTFTK